MCVLLELYSAKQSHPRCSPNCIIFLPTPPPPHMELPCVVLLNSPDLHIIPLALYEAPDYRIGNLVQATILFPHLIMSYASESSIPADFNTLLFSSEDGDRVFTSTPTKVLGSYLGFINSKSPSLCVIRILFFSNSAVTMSYLPLRCRDKIQIAPFKSAEGILGIPLS